MLDVSTVGALMCPDGGFITGGDILMDGARLAPSGLPMSLKYVCSSKHRRSFREDDGVQKRPSAGLDMSFGFLRNRASAKPQMRLGARAATAAAPLWRPFTGPR